MTALHRPAASAERRDNIEAGVIAATERLLRGGTGFTELTMKQIADEAGLARSTLYLYFREKSAVLIRMGNRLGIDAYEIVNRWHPGDPSGFDGLAETLFEVIRYYRERAHILVAILEVSAYDRTVREHWNAELDRFLDLSEQWLRAEQKAGHASPDLDTLTTSRLLIYGCNQTIALHVTTGDSADDHRVAREIAANQWFGGLRRPTPGDLAQGMSLA
ncbi:TetR/AcrR family transcriptional regulator [Actinoplanes sp. TBRC 11911]|uniref:TetR/AcrR family transcriptional regulator n=1 Tax=Actinoplanes sp. TBRC 11911 TaxID=2729386 RepID=UPI00145F2BD2|nr:TetR/AcrR family transcriptional regulator [Actinoplanes sp. TBRC 11911]NMO50080.1 TetR/AcrR family transcriptional regulator [Actinoplanes sp. TBRC 11911]